MPLVDNPISEPVRLPNWAQFKISMFANEAYRRVSSSAPPLAVTRIESFFAIHGRDVGFLQRLWTIMLEQCPTESRPTVAEAQIWRQIAVDHAMPVTFSDGGQIEAAE